MKIIGSQRRETLEEAGYRLIRHVGKTGAILQDKETGEYELWVKRPHYAGYVVEIKGIAYEFVRTKKEYFGVK